METIRGNIETVRNNKECQLSECYRGYWEQKIQSVRTTKDFEWCKNWSQLGFVMIVVGWRSVSKEIMERDTSVWNFLDEQYLALFMVNSTHGTIHMEQYFLRWRQEKLGLAFFKKRLGLEFLLWYHIKILKNIFSYY